MNKNAPFDYNLCIAALLITANDIQTQFYNFCLYLTFKKSLKNYGYDLNNLDEDNLIRDADFFETVDDPFVVRSYETMGISFPIADDIELRHGLSVMDCYADREVQREATRYQPIMRDDLITKSYARVLFYYINFYDSVLLSLYYYACALSVGSYKIPKFMRTRLDYSFAGSFKFLNLENQDVLMVLEAMESFLEEQQKVKDLVKQLKPYVSCPKV